jgi:hypothetical protein
VTSEPKPTPSVTVAGVDLDALFERAARIIELGRRTGADGGRKSPHNIYVIAAELLALARSQERPVAGVDEVEAVLREIVEEFGGTIEQYHRTGPDYTFRDGTEVFEVSTVLDREPIIARARAILALPRPGAEDETQALHRALDALGAPTHDDLNNPDRPVLLSPLGRIHAMAEMALALPRPIGDREDQGSSVADIAAPSAPQTGCSTAHSSTGKEG